MTRHVKEAVAILKRSRSLKWDEADVRAFARELSRLGENGLLKTWFAPSTKTSPAAGTAKQLDKRLAGLSRQVSAEKGRLIQLLAEYLRENDMVSRNFPGSAAMASGPRFFDALCAEVGEDRAVRSYSAFENQIRQQSSRKYKF